MKYMRKLIALVLMCSLIMSTTVNAMYISTANDAELAKAEQTLYVYEAEDARSYYEVTSLLNDDGTYTIRGYKEDNLVEEYVVMPGSGSYIKRTFRGGVIEREMVLFEETTPRLSGYNDINNSTRSGYLGTMYYNNVHMGLVYMIYCTIDNSIDVDSEWWVQSFEGTVAEWTVKLIAMLGLTASIASGAVQSFLVSAAFEIAGGAIHNLTTMKLKATVVSHTITGTSTSPLDSSYHEGTIEGETATVTAPGSAYEGYTYTEGYTPAHWGNNSFGRAMFREVYNSDWTPTGWTD